MREIDHEYTKELVCPHCGYEFEDSYEYNDDIQSCMRKENYIDCPECDKKFGATMDIEVSYSTHILDICDGCGDECDTYTIIQDGKKKKLCPPCDHYRRYPEDRKRNTQPKESEV